MPKADFFARLGLFVRRSFFDPAFCDELREAISMGEQQRAAVLLSGDQLVDEGQRRSRRVRIEQRYDSVVRDKLQALIPELEKHFDLQLRSFENPQVLIYDPGDRFKVHRDGSERAAGPAYLRERKVSIVAFLNGSSTDTSASGFRGGELYFYRLDPAAALRDIKQPLIAESGLLIGFRSDVFHEVAEVTHGRRHTVVSWYR